MEATKKYTVITGASSGIGYEAAKALAARGKNLILVARRQTNLEELKKEILAANPDLSIIIQLSDLTIREKVYQLYEDLKAYKIETWINNAGNGLHSPVTLQNLEKAEQMVQLNINSLLILSTLYAQDYKDVEGTTLVNLSSIGGYSVGQHAITYCATKFFVSAFTEGLAKELEAKGHKMRAKILAPAVTDTEFAQVATGATEKINYSEYYGRHHTSQEMAQFLLQLLDSDKTVGLVDPLTYEFNLSDNECKHRVTNVK
jgi:Short-chain dehydrogenases of various substrate specificities